MDQSFWIISASARSPQDFEGWGQQGRCLWKHRETTESPGRMEGRGGGELLWLRKGKGLVERNAIKAPWRQNRVMERSVPFNNALFFFSCPNEILGHVHRQSSAGGKWPDRGAIKCLEMMLFWGGCPALPPRQFHSKKLQNCTKQKVLLCNPSTELGWNCSLPPGRGRAELEPVLKEDSGVSTKGFSIMSQWLILIDNAALGIAF